MIVIYINNTRTKVYYSDPKLFKVKYFENQILGTLGITGLYFWRVLIDKNVYYFDVDLSFPRLEAKSKG